MRLDLGVRGAFKSRHHAINLGELREVIYSWSRFHVKSLDHDTFRLTFYSDRLDSVPQCAVPSPAYPAHLWQEIGDCCYNHRM